MNEEMPHTPEADDDAGRDLQLMLRIKSGDMEAFEELVERHQRRVIGTCARMLGDDTEAEDLAQRVFLRVWRNAANWEPSAKFTTWLYTILRNLVFNECRRRSRHPAQSLDATMSEDDRPMQMEDHSVKAPDVSVLHDEMQAAIDTAIAELPETQRLAVVMRRYDDVSYEEIGEVLGLTLPAVKSLLFRARAVLREKLKTYLEG